MKPVLIVDYGIGNSNSIQRALTSLNVPSLYSSKPKDVERAEYIILPGVGHCSTAMGFIRDNMLAECLEEAVIYEKKPVLGICLGMQLMTRCSEEGPSTGLGWVNAVTERIMPQDKKRYKVPHVGWNTIRSVKDSVLLAGIDTDNEPFYFCHSFAMREALGPKVLSTVNYEKVYLALFEMDNIFGVQFHPEKSQECGLTLLKNFLSFRP